ncbi:ammonium transporter, partial [Synechococcus sp. MU1644]|nr:ammonium transporter [Synechococcus sp. MU1644]
MKLTKSLIAGAALTALPTLALAQDAAPGFDEIGPYIMTTLLFCMAGFLVFFMAAGFAMLEGGLVRSKNVTMQMTKNIGLFSIAAIMYWLVGFNTMYPGEFNGYFAIGGQTVLDPVGVAAADAALDYASVGSDFFFQLVFVAATASIVSGVLAERIKLWPFLIFVVVLTGFMYPISGSWKWGAGWLDAAGFQDFAGSTVVHSVG